jgi:hypothetical protein
MRSLRTSVVAAGLAAEPSDPRATTAARRTWVSASSRHFISAGTDSGALSPIPPRPRAAISRTRPSSPWIIWSSAARKDLSPGSSFWIAKIAATRTVSLGSFSMDRIAGSAPVAGVPMRPRISMARPRTPASASERAAVNAVTASGPIATRGMADLPGRTIRRGLKARFRLLSRGRCDLHHRAAARQRHRHQQLPAAGR